MEAKSRVAAAAKAAFPRSLPILAGFTFLGLAYGIYMNSMGFGALYSIPMSITVFAGTGQFLAANLLTQPFDPVNMLVLTLLVNARHIFYGISMLEKYRDVGKKKWYMVFGMCDETFTINCTAIIPHSIDRGWFYFFVTLFDHAYWVMGTALGALCGEILTVDTTGIDFVMTALFLVIFVNQWEKEDNHISSLCGLGASLLCLAFFGPDQFILASMVGIFILLTLLRRPLTAGRKEETP